MFFTFTILLSFIFSFPTEESAKLDSSKAKRMSVDIRELPDSLQTKLFKLPQSKKKNFIYTPPSGIDYKIKIYTPDSTVDYKIKKYYPPDSLKKHLKNFTPYTK